jgi:hypothetical protein
MKITLVTASYFNKHAGNTIDRKAGINDPGCYFAEQGGVLVKIVPSARIVPQDKLRQARWDYSVTLPIDEALEIAYRPKPELIPEVRERVEKWYEAQHV